MQNLVGAGREIAGLTAEAAEAQIREIFDHVRTRWRVVFEEHAGTKLHARPDDWANAFEPNSGWNVAGTGASGDG